MYKVTINCYVFFFLFHVRYQSHFNVAYVTISVSLCRFISNHKHDCIDLNFCISILAKENTNVVATGYHDRSTILNLVLVNLSVFLS